jgi:CMP-N,N'-diacetyllegionaminic acid synthase
MLQSILPQKCICIIGARAESRRLPNKNKLLLAGKPLYEYTVDAAQRSGLFEHILFSTDDQEILEGLKAYPQVRLHERPERLAGPDVSMITVLDYLIQRNKEHWMDVQTLGLLTPCHPMRTHRHIREAYRLYLGSDAEALVSISPFPCPPERALQVMNGYVKRTWTGLVRKEEHPQQYYPNGAITFVDLAYFMYHKDFYPERTVGYLMDWISGLDIDYPDDFLLAEKLIRTKIESHESKSHSQPAL